MNKTIEIVKVGIADLKVASTPQVLRTAGLGSCVGVIIYDLSRKVAGMAHIMLPESSLSKNSELNRWKYADTAVSELLLKLERAGARRFALKAKLAGGAQMFQYNSTNEMMRIGPRNVQEVLNQLAAHHIQVVAKDVGGNCGRTIEFDPEAGSLKVKTINKGETYI